MIEMARVSGSLPTLDPEVPGLFERVYSGRQKGGHFLPKDTNYSSEQAPAEDHELLNKMIDVLEKNNQVLDEIIKRLKHPITAEVSLTGNKGFYEKDLEYKRTQKNAYN